MTADLLSVGRDGLPTSGGLIVSGDYKTANPDAVEIQPLGATKLGVLVNISAQTGAGNTLTVNVEGHNPVTDTWITLARPELTAEGHYHIVVDPAIGYAQQKAVTVTAPGAGADLSYTVPATYSWQFRSISGLFTADGTVANRNLVFLVTDASDVMLSQVISSTNIAASGTNLFSLNESYTGGVNALSTTHGVMSMPFAGVPLQPGWKVKSAIVNKAAGDALTNVRFVVVERPALYVPVGTGAALFPRLRVRPVKSGTTTTLTYSVAAVLSL